MSRNVRCKKWITDELVSKSPLSTEEIYFRVKEKHRYAPPIRVFGQVLASYPQFIKVDYTQKWAKWEYQSP